MTAPVALIPALEQAPAVQAPVVALATKELIREQIGITMNHLEALRNVGTPTTRHRFLTIVRLEAALAQFHRTLDGYPEDPNTMTPAAVETYNGRIQAMADAIPLCFIHEAPPVVAPVVVAPAVPTQIPFVLQPALLPTATPTPPAVTATATATTPAKDQTTRKEKKAAKEAKKKRSRRSSSGSSSGSEDKATPTQDKTKNFLPKTFVAVSKAKNAIDQQSCSPKPTDSNADEGLTISDLTFHNIITGKTELKEEAKVPEVLELWRRFKTQCSYRLVAKHFAESIGPVLVGGSLDERTNLFEATREVFHFVAAALSAKSLEGFHQTMRGFTIIEGRDANNLLLTGAEAHTQGLLASSRQSGFRDVRLNDLTPPAPRADLARMNRAPYSPPPAFPQFNPGSPHFNSGYSPVPLAYGQGGHPTANYAAPVFTQQNTPPPRACYICRNPSHLARDCPMAGRPY